MVTVFNRRERITLSAQEKLFHIREALSPAGIESGVKLHEAAKAAERARYGTVLQDVLYSYAVTSVNTTMTAPLRQSNQPCAGAERNGL